MVMSSFDQGSHLYSRRSNKVKEYPQNKLNWIRLFQLSDYIYSKNFQHLELKNHNILLHCREAGSLGDISQTFLCAEMIKKHRPNANIILAFELETKNKEEISKIFPVDRFETHFLSHFDYFKREDELKNLIQNSGCVIGIAVGIGSSLFHKTHHRTVREYGFSWHPDTKENILSMGFEDSEEGINIPFIPKRQLSEIQSPWLKNILATDENYLNTHHLYHMYLHNWEMQIASLYSIIEREKNKPQSIDIVLPLKYSIKQLIDWKILDPEIFKQAGIGKITYVTPNGSETTSLLGEGKELRILNGPIHKQDMEIIQKNSNDFFGCTGDLTYSESVALNKIPFYDVETHKEHFFNSIKKLAAELKLESLLNFLNLIDKLGLTKSEIYKKNTPAKKSSWWRGETNVSYDIAEEGSVAHRSLPELLPIVKQLSLEIAKCSLDPKLFEESTKLNEYIKANLNFESRLMSIVDRGLALGNYPELIENENNLWKRFSENEISIENVFSELKNTLDMLTKNVEAASEPSTPKNW